MNTNSYFSFGTQFENVGDTLINKNLLDLVSNNSDCYADFSRCPQTFKNEFSDSNYTDVNGYLSLCIQILKARMSGKKCNFFFSPGGYIGELSNAKFFNKIILTLSYLFLLLIGVNFICLGVSYESLGKKNRFFIKLRSKLSKFNYVRDKKTYDYCIDNNISVTEVKPDLAYYYDDIQSSKETQDLLFSFRVDQSEKLKAEILEQVTGFLADKKERNVVFYSQVERDAPFMKECSEHFSQLGYNCQHVDKSTSLKETLAYFTENQFNVISNRLHVLLVSTLRGSKIIPVSDGVNNNKIEGLFKDANVKVEQFSNIKDFKDENFHEIKEYAVNRYNDLLKIIF
ncbi:polysaccharide pyruvyl transferase family protein [Vibrio sp. SS-MA-C1-2]|uniref:polysaccharide pyruvyl transferase family protein n=1 Tax=Vibrio sp. SS-MA-C1-2 TaxID=2908646 RepID=UPI001F47568C|nr:polysaccharide pyruvyl transferase family protein [Vibrio sp. SS-MA-C1-2]UJF17138.1 polysaccharide pyruvyl transferase family protein [Vibrio sp. SS-MA-C1-2]